MGFKLKLFAFCFTQQNVGKKSSEQNLIQN